DTPEWKLSGFNVETHHTDKYSLFKLFYNITMTRRSEFWVKMLIAPSFLIGCLILIGLFISAEGDTKSNAVNLGLTTMMSMTVILGILSDSIPKSRNLPVLGYFVLYEIVIIQLAVVSVIGRLATNIRRIAKRLGIIRSALTSFNYDIYSIQFPLYQSISTFVFIFFLSLHFLDLFYLLSHYDGC
ncbi:hypothetical protein PENTCL1PPCAC_16874, partial [Pristionchus entomophagus]